MVDYPFRTRLKILAKTKIIELKNNPDLFALPDLAQYKFRPEQMMVFHIEAYDWNCPQHIIPRFTIEEIELAFAAQRTYFEKLESEVKRKRHYISWERQSFRSVLTFFINESYAAIVVFNSLKDDAYKNFEVKKDMESITNFSQHQRIIILRISFARK